MGPVMRSTRVLGKLYGWLHSFEKLSLKSPVLFGRFSIWHILLSWWDIHLWRAQLCLLHATASVLALRLLPAAIKFVFSQLKYQLFNNISTSVMIVQRNFYYWPTAPLANINMRLTKTGLTKENTKESLIYLQHLLTEQTLQPPRLFCLFYVLLKILILLYSTITSAPLEVLLPWKHSTHIQTPKHISSFDISMWKTFTLVKGYPLIIRNKIQASENHYSLQ